MSDPELLTTIKLLIAKTCGIEPSRVADDGKLIGYGMDSVRMIELVMTLEDEFGVEISEHDPALEQVKTVRQLAEFVDQRR